MNLPVQLRVGGFGGTEREARSRENRKHPVTSPCCFSGIDKRNNYNTEDIADVLENSLAQVLGQKHFSGFSLTLLRKADTQKTQISELLKPRYQQHQKGPCKTTCGFIEAPRNISLALEVWIMISRSDKDMYRLGTLHLDRS